MFCSNFYARHIQPLDPAQDKSRWQIPNIRHHFTASSVVLPYSKPILNSPLFFLVFDVDFLQEVFLIKILQSFLVSPVLDMASLS